MCTVIPYRKLEHVSVGTAPGIFSELNLLNTLLGVLLTPLLMTGMARRIEPLHSTAHPRLFVPISSISVLTFSVYCFESRVVTRAGRPEDG